MGRGEPPFGFCADGVRPRLLQPASGCSRAAARIEEGPDSMLSLYRPALAIRRRHPALGDGTLLWLQRPGGANGGGGGAGGGVLLFVLEPGFVRAINVSGSPASLPDGAILLASGPLTEGGDLPAEIAVWLAVPPPTA